MPLPFNPAALEEIYEGDALLFQEIMDILCERAPGELLRQESLLQAGSYAELKHNIHRLKSALVSVGAATAAGVAEKIENLPPETDASHYSALFREFAFEINRLLSYYNDGEWRIFFDS